MIDCTYLVRHGTTNLNGDGKMRGWEDIPLSDKGVNQANVLGDRMKGMGINFIITSDLERAVQTAQAISEHIQVPIVEKTMTIRPWDVGKLEKEDEEEVQSILKDYVENKPDEPLPEGESFNEFKKRCIQGMLDIRYKYPGTIVIVTHHTVDRIMAGRESDNYEDYDVDLKEYFQDGILPSDYREIFIPCTDNSMHKEMKQIQNVLGVAHDMLDDLIEKDMVRDAEEGELGEESKEPLKNLKHKGKSPISGLAK